MIDGADYKKKNEVKREREYFCAASSGGSGPTVREGSDVQREGRALSDSWVSAPLPRVG